MPSVAVISCSSSYAIGCGPLICLLRMPSVALVYTILLRMPEVAICLLRMPSVASAYLVLLHMPVVAI